MELFVFGRFRAATGREQALERAIRDVLPPTREEPGCLGIDAFRSRREPQLFYIHSRWRDEPAFEIHAQLPHTVAFLAAVKPLVDELDIARMTRLDGFT
jgi:quinol monooxygenase YgiN